MGRAYLPKGAAQIVIALRAEGLRVIGVGSWETRERDDETGKAFGPVVGVMIHHTAGTNSESTVAYRGNSSAPPPLCHALLAKTGTVYMISNGRANHAGLIARNAHAAVVSQDGSHPVPGADAVDGNDPYYGLEIENLGNGEDPYPPEQYDAAVRYAAAHCRLYGWNADSVMGHKEATRRKVDPSFSMWDFRRHLRACLALPAGKWEGSGAGTSEEGDMDAQDVWAYEAKKATGGRNMAGYVLDIERQVRSLSAAVGALSGAVAALAASGGLDAAEIQAAAQKGAEAALAVLADALDGDTV